MQGSVCACMNVCKRACAYMLCGCEWGMYTWNFYYLYMGQNEVSQGEL